MKGEAGVPQSINKQAAERKHRVIVEVEYQLGRVHDASANLLQRPNRFQYTEGAASDSLSCGLRHANLSERVADISTCQTH